MTKEKFGKKSKNLKIFMTPIFWNQKVSWNAVKDEISAFLTFQ